MTVFFDGVGFEAEHLCVKQFNGQLLTDREHQYNDIDCYVSTKDGKKFTASVKDQRTSMKQGYTTIQLELEQVNTRTRKRQDGCFIKNKSDFYFWLVWYENKAQWLIIKSSKLKAFVKENKDSLRTWCTKEATEQKNRSYGRTYDRSKGVMINVSQLLELGQLKELAQ